MKNSLNGKIGGFTIIVLLGIGIVAAFLLLRKNDAPPLEILPASCERACWEGIEPGVTTQETVKEMLLQEGIAYKTITGLLDEENGVFEWSTQVQGKDTLVALAFVGGIVSQITLPLRECISTIIEKYGVPPNVSLGTDYSYLLYPERGLVFSVYSREDSAHISVAFLTSDITFLNFSGGELLDWSKASSKFSDECT